MTNYVSLLGSKFKNIFSDTCIRLVNYDEVSAVHVCSDPGWHQAPLPGATCAACQALARGGGRGHVWAELRVPWHPRDQASLTVWHIRGQSTCWTQLLKTNHRWSKSGFIPIYKARRTNRFCVCITKDSQESGNMQWKHKCGICEMRWK